MKGSMIKRTIGLFAAFALIAALLPLAALAKTGARSGEIWDGSVAEGFAGAVTPKEVLSGSCGANLTWTFDTETGELSITGTGNMSSHPWQSFKDSIITLSLDDGVTSICSSAFYYCEALTTVTGGGGITSIGERAFYNCSALTDIIIPEGITRINDSVFAYCTSLSAVTIPEGVTRLER